MAHAVDSTRTLVLFDIDGTLIQSGRAGARGMNLAFERLYGRARALDGVPIAGRTDRAIVMDVMRAMGVEPTEDAIVALRDAYFEALRVEILKPVADPSGVLPGVTALLDTLGVRDDVAVGLLTGNFAGGAAIKLGHFDLWTRFAFGAFGDAHVDRRALVPIARRAAEQAGWIVSDMRRIVVVGDTPLDVDCARAHGARAVGVATGPFDAGALREAGAELAFGTLEEARDLIGLLGFGGAERA